MALVQEVWPWWRTPMTTPELTPFDEHATADRWIVGYPNRTAYSKGLIRAHNRQRFYDALVRALRQFIEQFSDESNDEYSVAFDNVTNALANLERADTDDHS